MKKFSDLLWLWTLAVIPVALKKPELFLFLKPAIKPLLGSVILSMGLTLKTADFKETLRKPKLTAIGILTQYSVMPILGFIFGILFLKEINAELVAGEILTGSCPTGVVSNVYNFLAGANVALSISLSAVNTVISPVLTPIITSILASKLIKVDAIKLFYDMVQITLIPVILGIAINQTAGNKLNRIRPFLPVYSTVVVVLIVGFVISTGHSRIVLLSPKAILLLIVTTTLHLLFGFWFGYVIPRLLKVHQKERITISIETAMQNSGLATVLALSQWGAVAALPAITYSVTQNVIGPFVCQLFRWLIEKKAKISHTKREEKHAGHKID